MSLNTWSQPKQQEGGDETCCDVWCEDVGAEAELLGFSLSEQDGDKVTSYHCFLLICAVKEDMRRAV